MENLDKETVEKMLEDYQPTGETILVITTKPKIEVTEEADGVMINEGYDFKVNGAIPQLADAIAKLAIEMPKNGFGKTSDDGFIHYINLFYSKLKNM